MAPNRIGPTVGQSLAQSMATLGAILKEMREGAAVAGGHGLVSHFREVLGISPEVAHLDIVDMQGTITSATSITQPSTVRVHGEMDFEVYGITAYVDPLASPMTTPDALVDIFWNVRESGRSFDVFTTNQCMLAWNNISGPIAPVFFERSLYKFRAGSEIKTTLSVTSGATITTRKAGVVLYGNLIRRK